MGKISFISVLLVSTALFVSCSPVIKQHPTFDTNTEKHTEKPIATNLYGAYLAGRIAHLRKDFDNAADYYKIVYDKDNKNPELVDRIYLILTSKGRINEAAEYAEIAIKNKTNNSFAHLLVAISQMHKGDYQSSIKKLNKISDPIYRSLISPLLNTWNHAGLNDKTKAFAELNKLNKEKGFTPIYTFQKALLLDYFGENRKAGEIYEQILSNKHSELSVRMLEIITNFYIRTGQKEKAVALMHSTINNQALDSILASLRDKTIFANPKKTLPILSSALIGAAEALFTIASTFRYDEAIDIAHMYTALAIYMNPQYSTAKILMADIFEARDMISDANEIYDNINSNDIAYYPAQIKKARNLIKMEDYQKAELLLKNLSKDYDDIQIYIELGEILRLNNRYIEAIRYYDKAISKTKNPVSLWVLYYAKGVSQERAGQWKSAEETLMKAYKIKRHYLVLNHLGYTWIRQNQNVDRAFSMIVDAYNQAPFDPSINDSLGFALYNLGYYGMSLSYLERAAELYPSSAIISSHLGDAYWFAHRKNEAKFQWQHALSLKDDSGELDIHATKYKIKNGLSTAPNLSYDKEKIEETIKRIKKQKTSSKL